MIDSFDDLYDQIVQCERRVEEKQRLLNELRGQVQHYKNALQQTVENHGLLEKELLSKVEQHTEVQLNQTSLEAREAILITQKETLLQESASLQQDLTSLVGELEGEMLGFCRSVETHSEDLDLTVSGKQARKNKASASLEKLLSKEQTIIKETADYEVHKNNITRLEAERYCLQQSLCDLAHSKQELQECVEKEEEKLKELQEERQQVSKTLACGDEFNRLRKELSALNTDSLEQHCSHLQHQANALQQQVYSRQQQTLRQHKLRVEMAQPLNTDATAATTTLCHRRDVDENGKNRQLMKQFIDDPFDDAEDDDMTLPDLEVSMVEQMEDEEPNC